MAPGAISSTMPHPHPLASNHSTTETYYPSSSTSSQHTAHESSSSHGRQPSSTTSQGAVEPEIDFEGDVKVNNDLPSLETMEEAADHLLLDANGVSRPFRTIYEGGKKNNTAPRQLVIFVRHFFCGNCQEYLRTLSSQVTPSQLLSLPTPTFITVIGCGSPDLIPMYQQTTACPYPIYADPTKKLYDLLSMTRTLDLGKQKPEYIRNSFMGNVMKSVWQGVSSGGGALKGGDIKQVGGEFLFNEGRGVWCHRMRNTRDHCEMGQLKDVLGLNGGEGIGMALGNPETDGSMPQSERPAGKRRWSDGLKSFGRKRSESRGDSVKSNHKQKDSLTTIGGDGGGRRSRKASRASSIGGAANAMRGRSRTPSYAKEMKEEEKGLGDIEDRGLLQEEDEVKQSMDFKPAAVPATAL